MEIKVTTWKVSTLLKRKNKINEQPEYQRGKVWSNEKASLLIDSILRGIDIPKIYLRTLNNSLHDFEVADGQQRLNAIFDFVDNSFKLIDKSIKGLRVGRVENQEIGGLTFDELPKNFRDKILEFEITISIIENCTENEVRTLFGRLQEGVTLNPAEKRNAIISTTGKHIESIALNHNFFMSSKISAKRFKHQDYLAHVFALMLYNNNEDLKGVLLEKMYLDQTVIIDNQFLKNVDKILDIIHQVDNIGGRRIINKYSFVDIFWMLHKNLKSKKLDVNKFKSAFDDFERKRLKAKGNLTILSKSRKIESRRLYDYILAYDRSGSMKENIATRNRVFEEQFLKFIF